MTAFTVAFGVHPPGRLLDVPEREPERFEDLIAEQLPWLGAFAVAEPSPRPVGRGGAKSTVAVEDEQVAEDPPLGWACSRHYGTLTAGPEARLLLGRVSS